MLLLCVANAAYLAGLESTLGSARASLAAGTGGAITRAMRQAGYEAMALDEDPQMLEATKGFAISSGVVLGAAPVSLMIDDLRVDAVLPFKSSKRLWTMADHNNIRVLAAADKLTRQLENKLALPEIAERAQARIPDTVNVRVDEGFVQAAESGGIALPRVYQPAMGFAGSGTTLLRDANDVRELYETSRKRTLVGKLVEYVEGEPVTVNGVVVPPGVHGSGERGRVLVGMVARQLTGLAGLTPTEFGSCGNDWANPPSSTAISASRLLAVLVGEELMERGFVGAFGIDIVLPTSGGLPVLIEINPRWTASLALQVELQQRAGMPTLLDAHLAAFAYRLEERASMEEFDAAFGSATDAGVTRISEAAATILAFNTADEDVFVDPAAKPGVWRVVPDTQTADGPKIEFVRDGWRMRDLSADPNEFVLLPNGVERPISSGAYLARVILRQVAAKDTSARVLREPVAALMRSVVQLTTLRSR